MPAGFDPVMDHPYGPVVTRRNQRAAARRWRRALLAIAFVLPLLAGLGLAVAVTPNAETPWGCEGYLFHADFTYGSDAGLPTQRAAAKDALLASFSVSVSDQQLVPSPNAPNEWTVVEQDLPSGGPVHVITDEVDGGYVVEAVWQCQEVKQ